VSVFKVIDEAELRKIELAIYSEPECHADNLLEVGAHSTHPTSPTPNTLPRFDFMRYPGPDLHLD
jgi:hypothetical protein